MFNNINFFWIRKRKIFNFNNIYQKNIWVNHIINEYYLTQKHHLAILSQNNPNLKFHPDTYHINLTNKIITKQILNKLYQNKHQIHYWIIKPAIMSCGRNIIIINLHTFKSCNNLYQYIMNIYQQINLIVIQKIYR